MISYLASLERLLLRNFQIYDLLFRKKTCKGTKNK